MRATVYAMVIGLGFAGCTQTPPEVQVIEDAVAAMGGLEQVQRVNTLVLDGEGQLFNLGQNTSPDAELPVFDVTEYVRSIDFGRGRWRQEQLRTATFLTGLARQVRQIAAIDGDVAFDVNANGDAARAPGLAVVDRRASLRHHPIGMLQAAAAEGAGVTNHRQDAGLDAVDVTTADGDQFTLFVDATSKLPAKVASTSYHNNLGDVAIETEFADYEDVDGLMLPTRLISRIDRYTVGDLRVSNTVNGDVGDLAASADVAAADEPVPTANVAVNEVADGIWHLTGQSHHSILVEFDENLALIEAPQHDTRTLAVIERARELQPDKPLTHLINTHHHFDHSGGVRAAVSEGLTIITHELNKPFLERIVARQHTIVQDALARNPQPLTVETIGDKLVLGEGRRTVELYPVPGNAHAETMLIAYFPRERLLAVVDLYTPPPPGVIEGRFPFAASLLDRVETLGLRVDRIIGLHGGVGPFRDLPDAAAAEASRESEHEQITGSGVF